MTNISFTPLINQVNVPIGIVDDSISENLEVFSAELIAFVDRLTIDPDLATVYIVDNDSELYKCCKSYDIDVCVCCRNNTLKSIPSLVLGCFFNLAVSRFIIHSVLELS